MTEREEAYLLAEKLLDAPNADPDDELRLLSRQLLRHRERAEFGAEAFAVGVTWVKLVGIRQTGPDEPVEHGNCFAVQLLSGSEANVVNFYHENLEKLIAKGLTWPIRLLKFGNVCVIHDARIGERWYSQRYCEVCCPKELLPTPQQHRIQREIAIDRREESERCIRYNTTVKFQFE